VPYFVGSALATLLQKVPLWEKYSRKEVKLSDELFLRNARPTATQQTAVYKNSLRTRSNLPTSGSCLVRREGRARGSKRPLLHRLAPKA